VRVFRRSQQQTHAIVDAIALLGRDFTPTQAELRRALRTKADRLFWFDQVPGNALYEGKFNAPMLWNSNFFMTLESMKIQSCAPSTCSSSTARICGGHRSSSVRTRLSRLVRSRHPGDRL
jgi:hypothetical protein